MIAELPINPTAAGWMPLTRAGNMNLTRMKPANPRPSRAAKPRHRATKITPREDDGDHHQRDCSLEVGELVLRRLPVQRRDPDQRDPLPDLGAAGVEGVGERDTGDLLAGVVALEDPDAWIAQVCSATPGVEPAMPSQETGWIA